jgi:hypothetical protein
VAKTKETDLSFEQAVIAAYLVYVRGLHQNDVAIAMGGVNLGRVNEAVNAIKETLLAAGYAGEVK